MSPHYPEIKLPTFIVSQAASQRRRETSERLAKEVPGAQLFLLSDTGHYVQIQKADEVVEVIRKAAGTPEKADTADVETPAASR